MGCASSTQQMSTEEMNAVGATIGMHDLDDSSRRACRTLERRLSRNGIRTLVLYSKKGTCNQIPTINRLPRPVEIVTIDNSTRSAVSISSCFLLESSHLEQVNFSESCFAKIRCVGSDFMRGCSNLTSVSFNGDCFKKVQTVQCCFLRNCTKLESVTFGPGCFSRVHSIDCFFMAGGSNLKSVVFGDGCFSRVLSVGSGFMAECSSLKSIAFEDGCFAKVRSLGSGFMSGCTSLESITFNNGCFNSVGCFQDDFLKGCAANLREAKIGAEAAQALHTAILSSGLDSGKLQTIKTNWSWARHNSTLSASVRMAVLAIHQGITYKDSHGDEQYLPNEVAYEICGYIGAKW